MDSILPVAALSDPASAELPQNRASKPRDRRIDRSSIEMSQHAFHYARSWRGASILAAVVPWSRPLDNLSNGLRHDFSNGMALSARMSIFKCLRALDRMGSQEKLLLKCKVAVAKQQMQLAFRLYEPIPLRRSDQSTTTSWTIIQY
jgi:hypothetical protein